MRLKNIQLVNILWLRYFLVASYAEKLDSRDKPKYLLNKSNSCYISRFYI